MYPMSTVWVECWKCDECGYRWIKGEVWPERCPSRKCRKRQWDHGGAVVASQSPSGTESSVKSGDRKSADEGRNRDVTGESKSSQGSFDTNAVSAPRGPMPKMNDAMAKFLASTPPAHPAVAVDLEVEPAAVEVPLCPHEEWAPDGEQYRCRLVAGHKGKCVPGERVS